MDNLTLNCQCVNGKNGMYVNLYLKIISITFITNIITLRLPNSDFNWINYFLFKKL